MSMMLTRNNGFFSPLDDFAPLVRTFFEPKEETPTWAPPTDVFEHEDAVEIVADLPGLKQEEIHLSVENGVLTLRAERKQPERAEDLCGCSERPYGVFERTFRLGDTLDSEKIEARYEAGVLTIKVPKRPEVQPKRIEIKQ